MLGRGVEMISSQISLPQNLNPEVCWGYGRNLFDTSVIRNKWAYFSLKDIFIGV